MFHHFSHPHSSSSSPSANMISCLPVCCFVTVPLTSMKRQRKCADHVYWWWWSQFTNKCNTRLIISITIWTSTWTYIFISEDAPLLSVYLFVVGVWAVKKRAKRSNLFILLLHLLWSPHALKPQNKYGWVSYFRRNYSCHDIYDNHTWKLFCDDAIQFTQLYWVLTGVSWDICRFS